MQQLELFSEYSEGIFSQGCFNDTRLEKRGYNYLAI
jgi:hypothetical protein